MSVYAAQYAWLPTGLAGDVRITVEGGRITAVESATPAESGDSRLPGVVLPGFANVHSHAFHRALRGRTQEGGTFWTWRELMYQLAGRLDPDGYLALARAVYAEMALAGVTAVGEFHYLHHTPDGSRYQQPNVMGEALIQAARDAGIRLTLLDTCYLAGGLGKDGHLPLDPVQRRFSDGSADAWLRRTSELRDGDQLRIGAAIHSVRAVPRAEIPTVVAAAAERPLHVHVSEQLAENAACRAFYGETPVELLNAVGALGPTTTAVHATHLTNTDIAILGEAATSVCFCPTTERDLADGIGPARALHGANTRLCLGSDQHAVIDLLEETRALEMNERLVSQQRGRFDVATLIDALTSNGHRALGWDDAGRIEPGARADLVAVRLDTPRTSGTQPEQAIYAATAADVDSVIVDGVCVVRQRLHRLGDIGRMLNEAIESCWR